MYTKQVIVMRKDLNMRRGKQIAQGAHASLGAILQLMEYDDHDRNFKKLYVGPGPLNEWLEHSFTKITLYVNSEEELIEIYNKAIDIGLNSILIEDNGKTEFNGVKTKTCIAIGPAESEKIDVITKTLPLL